MRADEHKRIDKKSEQRLDRRTFITKGLMAGGALVGGGLAISRLADANDGSATSQSPRPTLTPARPARRKTPSSAGRPNILVIIVDQLRSPQWFGARAGRTGPAAEPRSACARRGLLRTPLHRLQRLHAGARGAADRPLHPPDRLHDHRRQHARSGLPDVGLDAARARLPHVLVRQVAPHPRRQPLDAGGGRARARALRLRRRHLPLARRRPRPGLARGSRHRRAVRALVRDSGEAEPWCTTVSFVNPHDIAWWYVLERPRRGGGARRRASSRSLPPNFETPEQLVDARQAAPAALAAGNRRRLVRRRCRSRARKPATRGCGFLDLYVKLQREVDATSAACCDALESRREVAANTVVVFTSDHGEYGASHGLRGKGAGRLRGGDPRAADRQGPARRARPARPSRAHAAHLERRRRAAAADDRHRLGRLAPRAAATRTSPTALDLAEILADPRRAGPPVRAARDRRDRDRVRDRALRRRRAAARRRDAHAEREVRDLLQLARRRRSTPLSAGQEARALRLPHARGRLELDNSAGAQPAGGDAAARCCRGAYATSCARRCRAPASRAHARGFADYFTTRHAAVAAATRPRTAPNATRRAGASARAQGCSAAARVAAAQASTVGEVPITAPAR